MGEAKLPQYQQSHATEYMRYNEIFRALREDIGLGDAPRILVFGCSTGEELLTLRHFWPHAQIEGCDISDDVLEEARSRAPFAHVFRSTAAAIRDRGQYDLITANSVLCRHPFPKDNYAERLPFRLFEEFVVLLLSCLHGRGWLMAYNTNYFLADLDIYADLTPAAVPAIWNNGFVPRVDPAGERIARPVVENSVLRRFHLKAGWDPWERMRCPLFQNRPGRPISAQQQIEFEPQAICAPAGGNLAPALAADVFEPWHLDTLLGNGTTLRQTMISVPHAAKWRHHGCSLIESDPGA